MNVNTIRTTILKFWPLFVAACGAIYYASTGDYAHALGALGLGGAATLTGDSLHREPVPVIVPVVAQTPLIAPHAIVAPSPQGETSVRKDRPS